MGSELTREDYQDLLNAVDAWEKEMRTNMFLNQVMTRAMLTQAERHEARFREVREAEKAREEEESLVRKERAIFLRAKLLALKNALSDDAPGRQ